MSWSVIPLIKYWCAKWLISYFTRPNPRKAEICSVTVKFFQITIKFLLQHIEHLFLPSIVEKHILIFLKILINYLGILFFSSYPIKLYELWWKVDKIWLVKYTINVEPRVYMYHTQRTCPFLSLMKHNFRRTYINFLQITIALDKVQLSNSTEF